MIEVGKTWSFNAINMIVEKDSQDYPKVRMAIQDILDASDTHAYYGGTTNYYRELQSVLFSGYDQLMLLIGSGNYPLISDQGAEGHYYIMGCKPTRLQALNMPNAVYRVVLDLLKFPTVPPPSWPSKVYVGTRALGVYYSSNFTGTGGLMPAWTEVRDIYGGGELTNIHTLKVDRSDLEQRQYVMTGVDWPNKEIYRRDIDVYSGEWELIMDLAGAQFLNGSIDGIAHFDVDYDGTIYILCIDLHTSFPSSTPIAYLLKSTDNGDNWSVIVGPTASMCRSASAFAQLAVDHGYIYFWAAWNISARVGVMYSTDGGATWYSTGVVGSSGSDWYNDIGINYGDPSWGYTRYDTAGVNLGRIDADAHTDEVCPAGAGLGCGLESRLWSSLSDYLYVRLLKGNKLYTTHDNWDTLDDPTPPTLTQVNDARAFAPFVQSEDEDMMIVGAGPIESKPHTVGILYGDDDITFEGKAGDNTTNAPYVDSIPYISGGACRHGVQAVDWA